MTRAEEIAKAIKERCRSSVAAVYFKCGAEWADAHQPSPWISVEERLPKRDGYYLVLYKRNNYMCVLQFETNLWKTIGYQSDITHWMPIPELQTTQ